MLFRLHESIHADESPPPLPSLWKGAPRRAAFVPAGADRSAVGRTVAMKAMTWWRGAFIRSSARRAAARSAPCQSERRPVPTRACAHSARRRDARAQALMRRRGRRGQIRLPAAGAGVPGVRAALLEGREPPPRHPLQQRRGKRPRPPAPAHARVTRAVGRGRWCGGTCRGARTATSTRACSRR
jgi:hypothetical protein